MPGMRVLDAYVYIGCYHLPPLKVHRQLTPAGIEGGRLVANPEKVDLPYGMPRILEVADQWECPRYLTRRGSRHIRKCPAPLIPATTRHHGCVCKGRRFSPCHHLRPSYARSLVVDCNGRLTQGLRKRKDLNSHSGRVTGVHPRVPTRLLLIPTPTRDASGKILSREMSGAVVLGSRRAVPTGRLAIRGVVRCVDVRHLSPRTCWRPSTGGT
jgi:hypothetical protein